MCDENRQGTATVIPGMRYQDAPAAIRFLGEAFGFEERLVVPDEDGGIAHAQLVCGNGMIMLGSARDDEHGQLMRTPAEAGGCTHGVYVLVEGDLAAHGERARAAGAEIVKEVSEQHYGGQLYSCKDPEGHLWNFGTYDPWVGA